MNEYEDIFDTEFDNYFLEEQQTRSDYFDEHADEMYEQFVEDKYQKLEQENKFVLINETPTLREYIIPGTDIYKDEFINSGTVKTTVYYKHHSPHLEDVIIQ